MGAVVFMNEEDSGFFGMFSVFDVFLHLCLKGPSSNIAFLRRISQAAVDASNLAFHSPHGDGVQDKFLDGGLFSFTRPGSVHSSPLSKHQKKVNLYVLPPEAEVKDLLHRFFSYPGYLYPYIHQDTFVGTYNQIKNVVRPSVTRSWLGLFNMILAMAVSTKIDNELDATFRFQESDVYYQRAYGLCGKLMLRGTSLEIGPYFMPFYYEFMLKKYQCSIYCLWDNTCKVLKSLLKHGLSMG